LQFAHNKARQQLPTPSVIAEVGHLRLSSALIAKIIVGIGRRDLSRLLVGGVNHRCLAGLRDHDIAVLVWDMMDAMPNGYDIPWSVHGAIFAYGIALLDNALLQPLAEVCTQEGRYEFMLIIAPLKVVGGTGSPANPIALF